MAFLQTALVSAALVVAFLTVFSPPSADGQNYLTGTMCNENVPMERRMERLECFRLNMSTQVQEAMRRCQNDQDDETFLLRNCPGNGRNNYRNCVNRGLEANQRPNNSVLFRQNFYCTVATTTPSTEPTTPSTEPTTPSLEPTTPSTEPTTPSTEPTTPSTEPTTPSLEPTTPSTEPTTPSIEPTTPSIEPTTPSTEPTTLSTEPTTLSTEPTTLSTEPTTPSTEPTTPSTEPTTPSTEPTTLSTEPTTTSPEDANNP